MNEYPHEIISCMEFQLHSIIPEIMQTFTQAVNFSNSSVARDFDWSVVVLIGQQPGILIGQ